MNRIESAPSSRFARHRRTGLGSRREPSGAGTVSYSVGGGLLYVFAPPRQRLTGAVGITHDTLPAQTASPSVAPGRRTTRLTSVPTPVLVALTAMVGVAIAVARCPSTIRHPELYAEDGLVWFSDAYNHGPWRPLLWAHTGYLQTFPRLVADLGLLVPIRRLPLFFLVVAVAVQVLPACFLVTRRLENVIPSLSVRCVLALLYFLLPNSQEVNANLTNAQWHLALLAFLVVIAADGGWPWRVFDLLVVALSALTGPFVVVLAPISLVVYLVRRRRWSGVLTALLFTVAILQLIEFATSGTSRSHFAPLGVTGPRLFEILGGQVVGGTAVGPPATYVGHLPSSPVLSFLLLLAGAAFVLFALWRGPLELRLLNVFAGAILLSALASPVVSAVGFQWQNLTVDPGARYWFLPTCALVVDVIWAGSHLTPRNRLLAVVSFACLACIVVFGVRNGFEYQALTPRPDWALESNAFTHVPAGTSYTFIETPAGFSFTLTKH